MGGRSSRHHHVNYTTIIQQEVDHSPAIQELLRQMAELQNKIDQYNQILTPEHHNLQVAREKAVTTQKLRELDLRLLILISERLQERRENDKAERMLLAMYAHLAPSSQDKLQFYQMTFEEEIQIRYPTSDQVLAWLKQACNIWATSPKNPNNLQALQGQPANHGVPAPQGMPNA